MKSFFLPYWPENPYQSLLLKALNERGIEIDTQGDLKRLIIKLRSGGELPDVVHLHWLPQAGLRVSAFAQWLAYERRISWLHRKGVPIVWTAHNLIPHESKTRWLDIWLSRRISHLADRVICHSSAARSEILEVLGPIPSKLKIIPHGNYIGCYPDNVPAATCRSQLGLKVEDLVYLFLGEIRPYKGVLDLIAAFTQLREEKARLILAGRPLNQDTVEIIAKCASKDPRILFRPGYVPTKDVQIYMHAADIVVFPYQKSLTSGALMLAMSFGRAAIAARHPGTIEEFGENGELLYDNRFPNGLLGALRAAGGMRAELANIGQRNKIRAMNRNWSDIARETEATYVEATTAAQVRS